MLKKLFGFGKNQDDVKEEVIYSPVDGELMDMTDVPDPVFSQKMMGDGVAVKPKNGTIVSPVDGEIIQLFHTKHAIGIRTLSGLELLIHIGLETVGLNGEGFEAHIKEGDKVTIIISEGPSWVYRDQKSVSLQLTSQSFYIRL